MEKLSGFLLVWGGFGGGLVLFCFVGVAFFFFFDRRAARQAEVLLAGDLYFSSRVRYSCRYLICFPKQFVYYGKGLVMA